MQSPSPQALLDRIQLLIRPSHNGDISKEQKLEACNLARKLWLELEEPGDMIDRTMYLPLDSAMTEVAANLNLFHILVSRSEPMGLKELAAATNCDPLLLRRLLRAMAGLDQLDEVDVDLFAANKFTVAYTTPKGVHMQRANWDWARHVWSGIPAWLKSINYQNPSDPSRTALNQAFDTDKHFFEFLAEKGFLDDFQAAMSSYRTDRAELLDIFPLREQFVEGWDGSSVFMVDVGGGRGHDLEKIVSKFPEVKAKCVLEDVPDVIESVEEAETKGFESKVYDFFTPQPVKGARAYHFRMILHDWPDVQSLQILANTVSAMKPGYSKLIINDIVLPDKGAPRFATSSDMSMMSLLASIERSAGHWKQLLEQAGLKKVKIWPGGTESVIEAELA